LGIEELHVAEAAIEVVVHEGARKVNLGIFGDLETVRGEEGERRWEGRREEKGGEQKKSTYHIRFRLHNLPNGNEPNSCC
jgi:hypothetical protein